MSEIRVNFASSIPLFPLPDAVLLPHALLPLHIFEARYRQMVGRCLDEAGQIAIGTFAGRPGDHGPEGPAPIRTAACVGQIIQHEALPDGRYNIVLHGVCRARIDQVLEPEDGRRYRLARLSPLEAVDQPPAPMPQVRSQLRRLLGRAPLRTRLRGVDRLMEWIDHDEVPTHALLELIGFAILRDTELKYSLLAESDPWRRAGLIRAKLEHLSRTVLRVAGQSHGTWPKGVSWN